MNVDPDRVRRQVMCTREAAHAARELGRLRAMEHHANATAHVLIEHGVVPGADGTCRCMECRFVAQKMAEAGYLADVQDRWWEGEGVTTGHSVAEDCARGFQRCHECTDAECRDNINPAIAKPICPVGGAKSGKDEAAPGACPDCGGSGGGPETAQYGGWCPTCDGKPWPKGDDRAVH